MDWTSCSVNGIPSISCIPALFSLVVYWAFLIAGVAALIVIIWAGIKYIRSGGDQKQVQSARQTLTFGILGLIIILASVFIVALIANITGASCIQRFGFNTCRTEALPGPTDRGIR